jgi:predicted homoserine dehydrogenase-like protein
MPAALLIGLAGSGYIARGFALALERCTDLRLASALTRREAAKVSDFPRPELLTNSIDEMVDKCELIVECSGDVIHATNVVNAATRAGKPVVTMDAEFHVTTGSHFLDRGVMLTEAQGDQPGSLAAMAEDARDMGFSVLVYGNRKGYYHPNPPRDQMQFWADKQCQRIESITAFTDGTKMQIEQALVANGLGATIACDGMIGPESPSMEEGGQILAREAKRLGQPIADYALVSKGPAGIFIACEADPRQQQYLEYLKLGPGPFYVLVHNYHLCHLELMRTVRRVRDGGSALLTNSKTPTISVAAIAKRELKPGERIDKGIGSFDVRGEAIKISGDPDHMPIGLVSDAVVRRRIEAGQRLRFDDLELPASIALEAWASITKSVGSAPIRAR